MADNEDDTAGTIGLPPLKLHIVPNVELDKSEAAEPGHSTNVTSITFETTETRGKWCRHMHQEYCREQRTVTCKDCGAVLDSFDAYMTIAENYARLIVGIKHLKSEESELKKRVEDLKRVERNVKARIRKVDGNIDLNHFSGLDVAEVESEIDGLFAKLGRPSWKEQCDQYLDHISALRDEMRRTARNAR